MSDTKKDKAGYVNLDYVVKTVMTDLDEYSMHNYEKYIRLAARGFTDLNMFTLNNIKVAYLPINQDNFTVNLPNDFVDYTKIGININGNIWTLTLNERMVLPRKVDDCGKTISEASNCTIDSNSYQYGSGFYFADHYRNGQYVGEMYGLGGGLNIGYYRLDLERRQIALSNAVGGYDEILLEYMSNGIAADGSTVVPRQAVQALVEYVHWKRVEYNERVNINTKRLRQDAYEREYEKLKFFEDLFTMDEYLDHTYSHYQSTPKR